jgi:hypothetical protein
VRGTWWIWAIPLVVFTVTGVGIILLSRAIPEGIEGSFGFMDRRTEMLGLGVFFIAFPALFSTLLALGLRRGAAKADRLRSKGLPCTAVVQGAERTGTTVNDVPEYRVSLEVRPPDRPRFETEMKVCVGMTGLESLRPGTEVRAWVEGDGGPGLLVSFDGHLGLGQG